MRQSFCIALALAGVVLSGCSSPEKQSQPTASKETAAADEPQITQFYATSQQVARGEKTLLCYGVENASAVWLEPPRQELSASLSRCIEVTPSGDTTYKLSAQSPGGKTVTRELKVAAGAARVRIVNVNVSALEVKANDMVSICYTVDHAQSVTIDPIAYRGGATAKGCATDQPKKSTTYTITANGAGGQKDQERVTVKVK